ncbi:MAG TPA: hypothetical protein VLP30_00445 [Desulfatirhabdiaceae bacterium]|nr:hypothetical protein [Desulfatirhabdiaceae bacterium]
MTHPKNDRPSCFGDLTSVFPKADDGLRHTPESCMVCDHKTACLRTAMTQKQGLTVREELLDRAYSSGMVGFLGRWSRKKDLHRKKMDPDF